MRYIVDHDMHIHSHQSLCSKDPEQNTKAILQYGIDNGYRYVCLTDHYWDKDIPGASEFYEPQHLEHLQEVLPLPRDPADRCKFYFGCETDMDRFLTFGVTKEHLEAFDFITCATTHLHMKGFTISEEDWDDLTRRAELYVARLNKLLSMDLPYRKMGIAHITCQLIGGKEDRLARSIKVLNMISDETFRVIFARVAELGMGIEINTPIEQYRGQDLEDNLRVYRLAKECGCKFFFGSDAHHPRDFVVARERFERIVDLLGLSEEDKFIPQWGC